MKKRFALLVLVLLLTLAVAGPAFADAGDHPNENGYGDTASSKKIMMGWLASRWNPGKGNPQGNKQGPTVGCYHANCPICAP